MACIFLEMANNVACKSKNRMIFEKWTDIQEIIGPANKWPVLVRKLFWKGNIQHFDRLLVASFVYVNGLNPVIFLEWARLISLCRDETGYKHFEELFKFFDYRKYKLGIPCWKQQIRMAGWNCEILHACITEINGRQVIN